MTVIFGRNEAAERMQAESMRPNSTVAADQDYSANAKHSLKNIKDAKMPKGEEQGIKGPQPSPYACGRAMGGAVKERRGFYKKK